jgi:hypothetical protein
LKGAKAADLPIERPMKFDLAISLIAAKKIGVTREGTTPRSAYLRYR